MSLSTAQKNALNSGNPNALALAAGVGDLIDSLLEAVASGNLGITSFSWDVNNLAGAPIANGGATNPNGSELYCAYDADNTTGLDLGYFGGLLWDGDQFVTIAQDVISLSASQTNYVEAAPNGAVSANTSGFTAGSVPLFVVVTGSSSITSVRPVKPLLRCFPSGGLPGSQLSTAQKTKQIAILKGTLSATGTIKIPCPSAAATLTRLAVAVDTTITTSDTNYWTFSAVNKGATGSGSTAVLDASDTNTTKATGGSGITNFVERALSLSGTPANLITAANDLLVLSATKASSAADLVSLLVIAEFTIGG
jgi:hypothetical protein